jgi:hypothetical protein
VERPLIVGYDLVRPLSDGPGAAWLAHGVQGEVVVKVYPLTTGNGDELIAFASRAGSMAALDDPHLARLKDRGKGEGLLFTVRAYYPAGSLLTAAARLSEPERLRAALTVGRALERAHQRGLSHGALKPENVLIDGDGQPTLADFSFTSTKASPFAAPEQAAGARLTPVVDQYSLAALTVWLLTGQSADVGQTLSANQALDRALRRALSPSPGDRFRHFDKLLDQLESGVGRRDSDGVPAFSVQVDRSPTAIRVRVSGRWTPESVGSCVEQVSRALDAPGSHALGYFLEAESGCHSTAIEALAALHLRYRDRLTRVGFVSGTPQARGASVLIGSRVEGLPWKTFASADSMASWLSGASA